jgi:hypothetical protein
MKKTILTISLLSITLLGLTTSFAKESRILTSCIARGADKTFEQLEEMAVTCCQKPSSITGLPAGYALSPSSAVRMRMTGIGMDFSRVNLDDAAKTYIQRVDSLTKTVIVTCSRAAKR